MVTLMETDAYVTSLFAKPIVDVLLWSFTSWFILYLV